MDSWQNGMERKEMKVRILSARHIIFPIKNEMSMAAFLFQKSITASKLTDDQHFQSRFFWSSFGYLYFISYSSVSLTKDVWRMDSWQNGMERKEMKVRILSARHIIFHWLSASTSPRFIFLGLKPTWDIIPFFPLYFISLIEDKIHIIIYFNNSIFYLFVIFLFLYSFSYSLCSSFVSFYFHSITLSPMRSSEGKR